MNSRTPPELRTYVAYERRGNAVRLTTENTTNHEIRELMVGLWLRLQEDDRIDHLNELAHYLNPSSQPSPIAQAIREAGGNGTVDLMGLQRRYKEHPG